MKQLSIFLSISVLGYFLIGCKKNSENNYSVNIIGNWKYVNSTVDTLKGGQWGTPITSYDASVAANFADSLSFTAAGTVYYTYYGITTWSNYKVFGNSLILIGSGSNDTLTIHALDNSSLLVGSQTSNNYYWANFAKY